MHKGFLKTGALLAALAVILGAFAAHKIKGSVSDNAVEVFETAAKYLLYHSIALLITGIIYKDFQNVFLRIAGKLFITGLVLFSGSLFYLSWLLASVAPGKHWAGAITPFGGLAFILGWIFLFVGLCRNRKS